MRVGCKVVATAVLLSIFVLQASLCFLFIRSSAARHRFAARNLSLWSRLFLSLLGTEVELKGLERLKGDTRRFLIISNHLSYIDVLVISSRFPSLFVTSVEIEQSAGLGHICRAGGSYFVERRSRAKLREELESLGKVLSDGVNLAIFPEGTTGNGDGVMPFKKSLFGTAVLSDAPVLPLCIRYSRVDGRPIGPEDRDSLFYYGDMTFIDHFKRYARYRRIEVELEVMEPLDVSSESCRKELAGTAQQRIGEAYEPVSLLRKSPLV